MFYVAYEDKGPNGAGGQTVQNTASWKQLHVYNRYEEAKELIRVVKEESTKLGRRSPKITGFWCDEDVTVVHHTN